MVRICSAFGDLGIEIYNREQKEIAKAKAAARPTTEPSSSSSYDLWLKSQQEKAKNNP